MLLIAPCFFKTRGIKLKSVHPAFDTQTRTWFCIVPDSARTIEAPSLADLQALIGADVTIIGYHPVGTATKLEIRPPRGNYFGRRAAAEAS